MYKKHYTQSKKDEKIIYRCVCMLQMYNYHYFLLSCIKTSISHGSRIASNELLEAFAMNSRGREKMSLMS